MRLNHAAMRNYFWCDQMCNVLVLCSTHLWAAPMARALFVRLVGDAEVVWEHFIIAFCSDSAVADQSYKIMTGDE